MRCRSGGSEPGGLWPDSGVHRPPQPVCGEQSVWCGWEQQTREEAAMRSRREKMEAGSGWGSGGGNEFRFQIDFVGLAQIDWMWV